MEEKIDRLESMISQLITMVAGLRQELKSEIAELRTEFKSDMAGLRSEFKSDMAAMSEKNDIRHEEVMEKLNFLDINQDITWEKTVKNEREIERLRKQLNL